MKAIVVYFSLEGNSKFVADKIAEFTDADKLRLKTAKNYPSGSFTKRFVGGRQVIFGKSPELMPYKFDADKYDLIIIGTPVWAGSFSSPIKTFIKENDLSNKKIALFCCAGVSAGSCFEKLKKELRVNDVTAALSLVSPLKNQSEENLQKIKKFCENL